MKTPPDKTDLVRRILHRRAEGGEAYAESDKLTKRLARLVKKNELIQTPEGVFKIVNNFTGKDRAMAIGFARRVSLEKASKDDLKNLPATESAVPA